MRFLKQPLALLTALVMLCALWSGCAGKQVDASEDDNTLSIVMLDATADIIMPYLVEKFPDIHFEVERYFGSNLSYYKTKQIERGEGGDIFYYSTFYDAEAAPNYLVDLSGYDFLVNFDKAILSTLDVNGSIYQIPGPITIRYVMLNKTLFEEKGWKIPENFDELVAVCKQIHEEEPDITPMAFGTSAMGYVFTLVTSYAQMGFLDTALGQEAERKFLSGEGSFGDAFGEGLDMVGELIDAGAFNPSRFSTNWEIPLETMFNREVAMSFVMSASLDNAKAIDGGCRGNTDYGPYCNDEFIALPMFGRSASNKGLILNASSTWGISKYLENPGNEKKLENALRVMEYLSTEEGQLATRTSPSIIPPLRELTSDTMSPFARELWNDPNITIRDFFLYTGYNHMLVESAELVYDAMEADDSTGMKEKVIEIADRLNYEHVHHAPSTASFGDVTEDFTLDQTRQLCCEILRETVDADFAIASDPSITNGVANQNGFDGRFFEGYVTHEVINVVIANLKGTVQSMELTGQEFLDLMKAGKTTVGVKPVSDKTETFAYFMSGGELVKKDGVVTGINLDGKPIDPAQTYKVAVLSDDWPDGYAETHEIVDSGILTPDAFIAYIEARGSISPN